MSRTAGTVFSAPRTSVGDTSSDRRVECLVLEYIDSSMSTGHEERLGDFRRWGMRSNASDKTWRRARYRLRRPLLG